MRILIALANTSSTAEEGPADDYAGSVAAVQMLVQYRRDAWSGIGRLAGEEFECGASQLVLVKSTGDVGVGADLFGRDIRQASTNAPVPVTPVALSCALAIPKSAR